MITDADRKQAEATLKRIGTSQCKRPSTIVGSDEVAYHRVTPGDTMMNQVDALGVLYVNPDDQDHFYLIPLDWDIQGSNATPPTMVPVAR